MGLRPDERLLERYTIRRELGCGATACVYLAHDAYRDADVALKAVLVGARGSDLAAQQLKHEVALYDRIKRFEHIRRIYDVHCEPRGGGSLLLLSMEYADGGSFRHWLNSHQSDRATRVSEGLEFFKHACRAVAVIHEAGLAHLDIKPENMLFVGDSLKLADLGFSRLARTNRAEAGTPAYTSPERSGPAKDVDVGADIYSLGAVLYEILSREGRPPFAGRDGSVRRAQLHAKPRPLPADAGVAGEVAMRCLSVRPEDRFATVQAILDALEEKQVAEPEEAVDSAKLPADLHETWVRALDCATSDRPLEALRMCRAVLESVPSHASARLLLARIEHGYELARRLYSAIEEGIGQQPLAQLATLLQQAVDLFPNHPDGEVVQSRLVVLARDYRESAVEGCQALGRRDWDGAMLCFEHAQSLSPGSSSIRKAISFVSRIKQEIQDTRAQIDAAADHRQPQRALELARELDRFIDETVHASDEFSNWEGAEWPQRLAQTRPSQHAHFRRCHWRQSLRELRKAATDWPLRSSTTTAPPSAGAANTCNSSRSWSDSVSRRRPEPGAEAIQWHWRMRMTSLWPSSQTCRIRRTRGSMRT